MGFGESCEKKCVYVIDFFGEKNIKTIEIPVFQKLESIVGDKNVIENRLADLKKLDSSVWVEVIYSGNDIFSDFSVWANEQIAN